MRKSRVYVSITFDDGYRAVYTRIFPLLYRADVQATVFLIVNKINKDGFLSIGQIKRLLDAGWEIESHTLTHSKLAYLNNSELVKELKLSRELLEEMFGIKVRYIAYPYSSYNLRVIKYASRYYSAGFTNTIYPPLKVNTLPIPLDRRMLVKRINAFGEVKAYLLKYILRCFEEQISLYTCGRIHRALYWFLRRIDEEDLTTSNVLKDLVRHVRSKSSLWIVYTYHDLSDNVIKELKQLITLLKELGIPVVLPLNVLTDR